MSLEPTAEEASTFTSLEKVADWAELPKAGDDPDIRKSLFELFGFKGTEHPRVLGVTPESEFATVLATCKVQDASPSFALRAQAGLWGRAARVATGAQPRMQRF